MKLEEFKVYQASMQIGEEVWSMVGKWDYFSKDTIGKQLVRSTDSIAANLSEGFGSTTITNQNILVIMREVHYLRPKPGSQKHTIEK